jgi:lysozyme family protein
MSDDLFDILDAPTAAAVGGYVNDPNDRGGETNHGITIAVARENGYAGRMIDMTAAQAKAIRRAKYYVKPGIYLIAPLSQAIAAELYDTGVNMGTGTAGIFLQRALNALNRGGVDYADIPVDGGIGPRTASALQKYLQRNGASAETTMLKALNCLQGARYIELSEDRAANERFTNGWMATRVGIAA